MTKTEPPAPERGDRLVQFHVDPERLQTLTALAEKRGLKLGPLARMMVYEALDRLASSTAGEVRS